MYIPDDSIATSGSQIGQAIDEDNKEFAPAREQSIITKTLNRLVRSNAFPTHIKIDVDGHEGEILDGAKEVLSDIRLKSILVEFNNNLECAERIKKEYGFTRDNRFNNMENHSRVRRGGNPENIIFTREG